MDLMGLEDNADFWDMGIDDEGEEIIPIKDLTKQPRSLRLNPIILRIDDTFRRRLRLRNEENKYQ